MRKSRSKVGLYRASFILGGILSIWSLLPLLSFGVWNIGVWFPLLGGIYFLLLPLALRRWEKPLFHRAILALNCVIALGTSLLIGIAIFICQVPTVSPDSSAAQPVTVVVMGARAKKSGPSRILKGRLDAAAAYLRANEEASCIVTGGQGENEPITEAKQMEAYLISMGTLESRIYPEDKALNSRENIAYSQKIIEEEGLPQSVVIVTDRFHLYRSMQNARDAGFTQVAGVAARQNPILTQPFLIRETFAVIRDFLFQ